MALPRHQRWFQSGWNAAIEHCCEILAEAPEHLPVGPVGERLLNAIDYVVRESLYDEDSIKAPTNAQLAKRFGCSRRTVQNWRAQGAPLDGRLEYLLDWWATRRSLPRGTALKFREQLEKRGWGRSRRAQLRRGLAQVKAALVLAQG